MNMPTNDELEAMAQYHDWREDADSHTAAMLRACKSAPDHADWNAAIEAAAEKAETRFELCERDNTPPCYLRKCSIGRVLRALKKGPHQ